MNRLAVLILLALPLSLTARADDASLHAKATQVALVLHTDRMVQQVTGDLNKKFAEAANRMVNNNPTADQAKQIADSEKKASDMIDSQLGWQALQASFTDLYARNFTEDELDGIIAFYKTPAGIAFLEKTPVLNSQITQLLQTKIAATHAQLRTSLDDLKKNLAAAPPATTNSLPPQPAAPPK